MEPSPVMILIRQTLKECNEATYDPTVALSPALSDKLCKSIQTPEQLIELLCPLPRKCRPSVIKTLRENINNMHFENINELIFCLNKIDVGKFEDIFLIFSPQIIELASNITLIMTLINRLYPYQDVLLSSICYQLDSHLFHGYSTGELAQQLSSYRSQVITNILDYFSSIDDFFINTLALLTLLKNRLNKDQIKRVLSNILKQMNTFLDHTSKNIPGINYLPLDYITDIKNLIITIDSSQHREVCKAIVMTPSPYISWLNLLVDISPYIHSTSLTPLFYKVLQDLERPITQSNTNHIIHLLTHIIQSNHNINPYLEILSQHPTILITIIKTVRNIQNNHNDNMQPDLMTLRHIYKLIDRYIKNKMKSDGHIGRKLFLRYLSILNQEIFIDVIASLPYAILFFQSPDDVYAQNFIRLLLLVGSNEQFSFVIERHKKYLATLFIKTPIFLIDLLHDLSKDNYDTLSRKSTLILDTFTTITLTDKIDTQLSLSLTIAQWTKITNSDRFKPYLTYLFIPFLTCILNKDQALLPTIIPDVAAFTHILNHIDCNESQMQLLHNHKSDISTHFIKDIDTLINTLNCIASEQKANKLLSILQSHIYHNIIPDLNTASIKLPNNFESTINHLTRLHHSKFNILCQMMSVELNKLLNTPEHIASVLSLLSKQHSLILLRTIRLTSFIKLSRHPDWYLLRPYRDLLVRAYITLLKRNHNAPEPTRNSPRLWFSTDNKTYSQNLRTAILLLHSRPPTDRTNPTTNYLLEQLRQLYMATDAAYNPSLAFS